jgi:hypothetical protein
VRNVQEIFLLKLPKIIVFYSGNLLLNVRQGTDFINVSTVSSRLLPELPVLEPFRMFKEQKSKMIFCLSLRGES